MGLKHDADLPPIQVLLSADLVGNVRLALVEGVIQKDARALLEAEGKLMSWEAACRIAAAIIAASCQAALNAGVDMDDFYEFVSDTMETTVSHMRDRNLTPESLN